MGVICSRCSSSNSKRSAFCSYIGNFNSRSLVSTLSPAAPSQQQVFFTSPAMQQRSLPNSLTPIPVSFSPGKVVADQKSTSTRDVLRGRGCLTTHYSWLLEGKNTQAALIRSATMSLFRQHMLSGLTINLEKIGERNLFEEREYVTVQRGNSTIFIYIASLGRDLYISRTTMVLPKISSTRVAIGSVLLLFLAIGFMLSHLIYTLADNSHLYSDAALYNTLLLSSLARFTIPLFTLSLLFLSILVCIRSCIHWCIEKDFWLLLRFNRLNAFQIDDITFLEQTTDNIIHNAVKQLGLDATMVTPPPFGYQHEQKIGSR